MKQLLIILSAILLVSCNRSPQPVVNGTAPNNTTRGQSVTAHTTENQPPRPMSSYTAGGGKWSQSGDAIDTTVYDAKVSAAEKAQKANPSDDGAKKALAEALFERGVALTEARQYAAALGDYRRALKFDPNHEDSKKWITQIVGIYQTLKKEAPKEGEEPPPLPFKKEA